MSSVLQYIHAFEKFPIHGIVHSNHRLSIRKTKTSQLSHACRPTYKGEKIILFTHMNIFLLTLLALCVSAEGGALARRWLSFYITLYLNWNTIHSFVTFSVHLVHFTQNAIGALIKELCEFDLKCLSLTCALWGLGWAPFPWKQLLFSTSSCCHTYVHLLRKDWLKEL